MSISGAIIVYGLKIGLNSCNRSCNLAWASSSLFSGANVHNKELQPVNKVIISVPLSEVLSSWIVGFEAIEVRVTAGSLRF